LFDAISNNTLYSALNNGAEFFYYMPRGQLTKDQMKHHLLKLKQKLYNEKISYTSDPKALADQYLNMVLDKINEYAN
jgi:hypothetical protein